MKNPIGVYSTYYHGCWGVYPFLPSGYIIASDISEGLFVLGIDSIHLGINDLSSSTIQASIFPNPVFDVLHLNIPSKQKTGASLQITDMLGKIILQQNINLSIGENEFLFDELKNQFSGIYIIQIRSNDGFWSSKFLKQ